LSARSPAAAALGPSPSGCFTVLVADDDPAVRSITCRTLEQGGHRVIPAGDGVEALSLFEKHAPDVVITDIRMPNLDGISLLERIRERSPTTEVILITGFAETGTVIDALRRGAANFLEKPFRPAELLRQVETSFAHCALAREATRLQSELEEERRRLEMHQRMATLGRLLAGLAHEVNNPLTFLKGNVELLRRILAELPKQWEQGDPSAGHDALSQAEALLDDMAFGAVRIQDLVATMRRFASPQKGARGWVQLAALMANSIKLAQAKRVAETATEATLPPAEIMVDADPIEVETCLVNLLVNAYEAVGTQGSVVRFSTQLLPYATGRYHGVVEVLVEDDGPGMPQAVLDEVFTPFFTRKDGGMGLGLSIAYEAAKRNGAQLELHSEEGAGTRAILRLPYDVREGRRPVAIPQASEPRRR